MTPLVDALYLAAMISAAAGSLGCFLVLVARRARQRWISASGALLTLLGFACTAVLVISPARAASYLPTGSLLRRANVAGEFGMPEEVLLRRVREGRLSDAELDAVVRVALGPRPLVPPLQPTPQDLLGPGLHKLMTGGELAEPMMMRLSDRMLAARAAGAAQPNRWNWEARELLLSKNLPPLVRDVWLNYATDAMSDHADPFQPEASWALGFLLLQGRLKSPHIERYLINATTPVLSAEAPQGVMWRGDVILISAGLPSGAARGAETVWSARVRLLPGPGVLSDAAVELTAKAPAVPLGQVVLPLEPGPVTVRAEVEAWLTRDALTAALTRRNRPAPAWLQTFQDVRCTREVALDLTVIDRLAPPRPTDTSAQAAERIGPSIQIAAAAERLRTPERCTARHTLQIDRPALDLAMEVVWRTGAGEHVAARFVVFSGSRRVVAFTGPLDPCDASAAELILRPIPDAARHARLVNRLYAGPELRFEVPIEDR